MTELQDRFVCELVNTFVNCGLEYCVISPGSRSAPIVNALNAFKDLKTTVVLDERSAGFFALGISHKMNAPALVVTTSGTAATNLLPSVAEASYSGIPIIFVTANRPREVQDVGAPQTINQENLFHDFVREKYQIDATLEERSWRHLFARIYLSTMYSDKGPGPVHVDINLKEPLIRRKLNYHGLSSIEPIKIEHFPRPPQAKRLQKYFVNKKRPIILIGRLNKRSDELKKTVAKLKIPVLASVESGLRSPDLGVVSSFELMLRHMNVRQLGCDVVFRIGGLPSTKAVNSIFSELTYLGVPQVGITPHFKFVDPFFSLTDLLICDEDLFLAEIANITSADFDTSFFKRLVSLDKEIKQTVDKTIAESAELTSAHIVNHLGKISDDPLVIFSSSSLPIRYFESYFYRQRSNYEFYANRGVNGIDGSLSTFFGISSCKKKNEWPIAVTGDLAFLHDLSGSLSLAREDRFPATVIVLNNKRGDIFSRLDYKDKLPKGEFERFFLTPHSIDLVALGEALGYEVATIKLRQELNNIINSRFKQRRRLIVAEVDGDNDLQIEREIDKRVSEVVRDF